MRFEQWRKELLGLNEYEEKERERVQNETLPKRQELLKLVTRQWVCEETGARVCTNGNGMLGDSGVRVWVRKPGHANATYNVDQMEPAELELVAKVRRALQAWKDGEVEDIVVDAPKVPPVEGS